MTLQLTKLQQDIFNEIGNVGAGNAATSLSTMMDKKINISLPSMELASSENILKEEQSDVMIVSCKIEGDLVGNFLVVFKKETAFPLIDMMLQQEKGTAKDIDENGKGAFKEMVNIIGGAYLDSLADMLDFRLMPQPPVFSYGKMISIKDQILKELPYKTDVISVITEMSIEGEVIFGDLFIIFDQASLNKIIEGLNRKGGA